MTSHKGLEIGGTSPPVSSSSPPVVSSSSTGGALHGASSPESPLCRDYVRNVCYRGSSCKYSHFTSASGESLDSLQNAVLFCHDFQNKDYNCPRNHCKFIHATKEEEDTFKASGYLPPLAKEEAIRKGMAPDLPAVYGQKPFCKDFLKNSCSRSSCKFRHITPMQYDLEMSQVLGGGETGGGGGGGGAEEDNPRGKSRRSGFYGGGSSPKYPRLLHVHHGQHGQNEALKRINQQLKQQVEDLKKRVSALSTTNEFLLDQNARLRRSGHPPPPQTSSVGPPQASEPPNPSSAAAGLALLEAACSSPVVHPSVTLTQPPNIVTLSQPGAGGRPNSLNLRPTVSLAPPNSALVQETRFLSYPITSILPPMQ